ncbi:hypothetical protein WICMUC_000834 [Wickerhamomyces mucosus]|uniref:Inosine/uridine-preferring nucleoside hydrolase domain-containing protein n=1 Tax=Wickerhamomyces mucosus TaxID=1378264 RepID=A0A9P8PXV1_9ASCO|nr:hypothetical protein WICMUC_000834 [Wickerhamomyces mucosus]
MTKDTKIPIWLDCDPGHDDTIALLFSLFHPNIKLLGVSTVFGNSSIRNTTYNALSILTSFNHLNIPVFQGNDKPIDSKKHNETAPAIHGENGLEGYKLTYPKNKIQNETIEEFYQYLNNIIDEYEDEISIVAIGPLTNISQFFLQYPDSRYKIKFISIMGGGIDIWNFKGKGEFNLWNDPKAANLIFQDDILKNRTILSPLNLTHTLILTKEIQKQIYDISKDLTNEFRKLIHDLMIFFAETYKERQGFSKGPPVHDPIAVYLLLNEYNLLKFVDQSFKYEYLNLNVSEEQNENEGQILYEKDSEGVKVVFNVNVEQFWDILLSVIDIGDLYIHGN